MCYDMHPAVYVAGGLSSSNAGAGWPPFKHALDPKWSLEDRLHDSVRPGDQVIDVSLCRVWSLVSTLVPEIA